MGNRRDRIKIRMEILKVCGSQGLKTTRLLQVANVQYAGLANMVKPLIENGLLEKEIVDWKDKRTRSIYKTTNKGIEVLSSLKEFEYLMV